MKRKILITGATGFVGLHLIDLLDKNQNRICGTAYPQKPPSMGGFCDNHICHLDIRNSDEIFKFVEKMRPDWIIHLAAVSNVRYSWEKRKETFETNIMGTLNLFEAARKYTPGARLLFVSSSNVYGDFLKKERALDEEDLTLPQSPYAFTKHSGEQLSRFYADIEDLQVVITRAFPHTGPGQAPEFVCSDWALQIARIEKGLDEPVIKVGNIGAKRDFTDVRDVVKAYILLLEKGKKGEIYNISSGKTVLLEEILETLLAYSSESIKVQVDSKKLSKTEIESDSLRV